MISLPSPEYIQTFIGFGGKRQWYGYPRGFMMKNEIYINEDAFFIDNMDRKLLIAHEQGHIDGKTHTMIGIMCPWGLIRWLTAWC